MEPVYAMTVHRGQGSQFGVVTLLLPPADSPLLSRELLYTAVTRARRRVRVIGTPDAVRAGTSAGSHTVLRRSFRATGTTTRRTSETSCCWAVAWGSA